MGVRGRIFLMIVTDILVKCGTGSLGLLQWLCHSSWWGLDMDHLEVIHFECVHIFWIAF